MNPIVASDKLKCTKVWAEDDESVHWAGAFAVYGGHGTTASSTIVYEIEPGKRLGWHTDATEETQYIIAGDGELHMEDGSVHRVGRGSVFVLPTPVKHDLVNSRQRRKRNVARGRIFRGGDVHTKFRQRDDAAEKPHPRHA
jgi:quercetin dioxygenase-like cupin family protein